MSMGAFLFGLTIGLFVAAGTVVYSPKLAAGSESKRKKIALVMVGVGMGAFLIWLIVKFVLDLVG